MHGAPRQTLISKPSVTCGLTAVNRAKRHRLTDLWLQSKLKLYGRFNTGHKHATFFHYSSISDIHVALSWNHIHVGLYGLSQKSTRSMTSYGNKSKNRRSLSFKLRRCQAGITWRIAVQLLRLPPLIVRRHGNRSQHQPPVRGGIHFTPSARTSSRRPGGLVTDGQSGSVAPSCIGLVTKRCRLFSPTRYDATLSTAAKALNHRRARRGALVRWISDPQPVEDLLWIWIWNLHVVWFWFSAE